MGSPRRLIFNDHESFQGRQVLAGRVVLEWWANAVDTVRDIPCKGRQGRTGGGVASERAEKPGYSGRIPSDSVRAADIRSANLFEVRLIHAPGPVRRQAKMSRPTADTHQFSDVAYGEIGYQSRYGLSVENALQRNLAGCVSQFEQRHRAETETDDSPGSRVPSDIVGWNCRPREDEVASPGAVINGPAHMVPDHWLRLPLVDQARSLPIQEQPGIDGDCILDTRVCVHPNLARCYLAGHGSLAASSWTFDKNPSRGHEEFGQFLVSYAGKIGHGKNLCTKDVSTLSATGV